MKYIVYWVIHTLIPLPECKTEYKGKDGTVWIKSCQVAHYKTKTEKHKRVFVNKKDALQLIDSMNIENEKSLVTAVEWGTWRKYKRYDNKPFNDIKIDSIKTIKRDIIITGNPISSQSKTIRLPKKKTINL